MRSARIPLGTRAIMKKLSNHSFLTIEILAVIYEQNMNTR